MTGPRHALTLRSKGQILTLSLGLGFKRLRWGWAVMQSNMSSCRHDCTLFSLFLSLTNYLLSVVPVNFWAALSVYGFVLLKPVMMIVTMLNFFVV